MMVIAFDIGGTMTKYGVFNIMNGNPKLEDQGAFPSLASEGGPVMVNRLCEEVLRLKSIYQVEGIALSTAGQIDAFQGKVVFASDNIPNYTGMPLKAQLEKQFSVPVSVENDVNCFLLGECMTSEITQNVLAITLGTGIGGAILAEGKLIRGQGFSAGEVGHIQLVKNGKSCTCGGAGCFEQYASTKALQELVQTKFGQVDLIDFFEKCKSGHGPSIEILEIWLEDLTDGLKSLIHVLNPGKVIIGGAIAAQGDFLENAIKQHLKNKIMPSYSAVLEVTVSKNGNISNLLGAVSHYMSFIAT